MKLFAANVLFLLFLLSEHAAHADPATRSVVFLQPSASSHPSFESVLEATRGPLGELGVEVLLGGRLASAELGAALRNAQLVAHSTGAVAVVWLDASQTGTGALLVYFLDPRRKRLLARSVAVSESETAAAEEVAVVLRSAVGALLEGADVAMTEVKVPEAPHAAPAPAATASAAPARPEPGAPQPSHLSVALGYVGTVFAKDESYETGGRIAIGLQPARSRWVLAVAYQFWPALRAETAQVQTSLFRHPLELASSVQLLDGAFRVYPELAFVLDPVLRRTERAEPPLVASPEDTRWLFALSTRVRARWVLGERFSVVGALGTDFVLNPFEQMTQEQAPRGPLYSLRSVRPLVEAGISVDLW